jgi:hypothetical protein
MEFKKRSIEMKRRSNSKESPNKAPTGLISARDS